MKGRENEGKGEESNSRRGKRKEKSINDKVKETQEE